MSFSDFNGEAGKMKTKKWLAIWSVSALLGVVLFAGCGKKETAEEQPAAPGPTAAPAATPIDPATAASVSGTVKFDGSAPKPAKIDMSQDSNCAGSNTAENIVVSGGHLENGFIYVKERLASRGVDGPKDPVTLTQCYCIYKPHVSGESPGHATSIVMRKTNTHKIH